MTEWYTFRDDHIGKVQVEFFRRMAFLHVTLLRPLEGMRVARRVFAGIKAVLRALGYRAVHVIIPQGDEKLYKFESLFGFEEVRRRDGFILMWQGL